MCPNPIDSVFKREASSVATLRAVRDLDGLLTLHSETRLLVYYLVKNRIKILLYERERKVDAVVF